MGASREMREVVGGDASGKWMVGLVVGLVVDDENSASKHGGGD